MRLYTVDSNPHNPENNAAFAYRENVDIWVAGITGDDAKGREALAWCERAQTGDVLFGDGYVVFCTELPI